MKLKNIILFSALALASSSALADNNPTISRTACKYSLSSMTQSQLGAQLVENPSSPIRFVRQAPADDYVPAEARVLRDTEFSTEKFATGDYKTPDLYAKLENPNCQDDPAYEHPAWFNLYPDCFEDGEIWGGHNLYPAGGMACLFNKSSYGISESNIVVPIVDASAEGYEGIVYLRFKVRGEKAGAFLIAEAVETNGMGPMWDNMGMARVPVETEWTQVEMGFDGGRESVILNLYNACGSSVYVDDIVVYQKGQPAQTPKLLPHSNYQGTSWRANWEAAPGADGYLLTVYSTETSYDPETGQMTDKQYSFLYQQEPVTETHFDVTGAVSGQKYFYYVQSYKGTPGQEDYYISIAQPEERHIVVNELMPTKLHPVTDLSFDGYTAAWDVIPGAGAYNYWAWFEQTAEADGDMVIYDDDFTGIVDGDGMKTGLTKENYDTNCYERFFFNWRQAEDGSFYRAKYPGWKGTNAMPYSDYICLDAWQYIYGNGDSGYCSPELDMSKNGGKFTVSLDCAANLFQGEDEMGNYVSGYPRVAVAVFNYHPETGKFQQDELQYFTNVKFTWKKATFNLTTGTERSIIGIYAVYAPENLYLDNIKVVQKYDAGQTLMLPFWYENMFTEGTTVQVGMPDHVKKHKLFHQVCGVKAEKVENSLMDKIDFLMSPMTPLELIAGTDDGEWAASVEAPSLKKATVQVVGDNTLIIQNADAKAVTIYDLSGRIVYSNASGAARQKVSVKSGSYIVKVGEQTIKISF